MNEMLDEIMKMIGRNADDSEINAVLSDYFAKLEAESREPEISDEPENLDRSGEEDILDNIPCLTMVECVCRILEYLEEQKEYGNVDITDIQGYIEQLVFEYLVRIGGRMINDDVTFQPLRHKAVEPKYIASGKPIKIDVPGIMLNSRVLIKAKVKADGEEEGNVLSEAPAN